MKRWQRIKAELAHRLRRKHARKQLIWARRMLDTPRHLWPAGVSGYAVQVMAGERPHRLATAMSLVQRGLVDASDARERLIGEALIERAMQSPLIRERIMREAAIQAGLVLPGAPPQSGYALSQRAEAAGLRNEVARAQEAPPCNMLTPAHIRTAARLLSDRFQDSDDSYQRARATLQLFLTGEEQGQVSEFGYFEVPSRLTPGRIYRVPLHDGVVSVYDDGKETMTICCRPEGDSVPWPDVMLAYKLGLQADEARWLATANKWATMADTTVPTWNEVSMARLRPIPVDATPPLPPRYLYTPGRGFTERGGGANEVPLGPDPNYLTPIRTAVETFLPRRVAEEVLRREASADDDLVEVSEEWHP